MAFLLYRCGHCSMDISESGRHHSECGRMRFPSMYLNQQLLFIPTEATSGLAITPFVHAGLASVTTRLWQYRQDWGGEACLPCVFLARKVSGRGSHILTLDSQVEGGGKTVRSCSTPAPICPIISTESRIPPEPMWTPEPFFKISRNESIRHWQED